MTLPDLDHEEQGRDGEHHGRKAEDGGRDVLDDLTSERRPFRGTLEEGGHGRHDEDGGEGEKHGEPEIEAKPLAQHTSPTEPVLDREHSETDHLDGTLGPAQAGEVLVDLGARHGDRVPEKATELAGRLPKRRSPPLRRTGQ